MVVHSHAASEAALVAVGSGSECQHRKDCDLESQRHAVRQKPAEGRNHKEAVSVVVGRVTARVPFRVSCLSAESEGTQTSDWPVRCSLGMNLSRCIFKRRLKENMRRTVVTLPQATVGRFILYVLTT